MAHSHGGSLSRPPPLPLSIAVRNLFPPLALTHFPDNNDNIVTAVGDNDRVAAAASSFDNVDCDHGAKDNINVRQTSPSRQQQNKQSKRIQSLASRKLSILSSVEDRCALVSREVLLPLRLDIIAKKCTNHLKDEDGIDNQKNSITIDNEVEEEEILIYSSKQLYGTSHPKWDHINEQIIGNSQDDDVLYARFIIMDHVSSNDHPSAQNKEWILAEMPLHPSQLRRLPTTPAKETTNTQHSSAMVIPHSLPPNTMLLHCDDGYTRVLPSVYWTLVKEGIISENMEPIVVARQDSDNYDTRGSLEGGGETTLFEDRAFHVLGQSETTDEVGDDGNEIESNTTGKKEHDAVVLTEEQQPMKYHDDDKVFDLIGKSPTPNTTAVTADSYNGNTPRKTGDSILFDDRVLDLLGGGIASANDDLKEAFAVDMDGTGATTISKAGDHIGVELMPESATVALEDGAIVISTQRAEVNKTEKKKEGISKLLPLSSVLSPSSSKAAQVADVEEIQRLIQIEQQLLEEEQQHIVEETDNLRNIMQQVQHLENDTLEIMKAIGMERTNLFRSEFRLEAHTIHLLQHLQVIFPIRLVPIHTVNNLPTNNPNYSQNHQYTIANLALPDDIHNPSIVSDDQLSTALGYVCHLVALMSKYLAIPLRYTLVCKLSRSAVLFDQGRRGGDGNSTASKVVYPLFRERGVIDREQLDYGFLLLERNVGCMLNMRGVPFCPEWNILAKVDKLLMRVIEGEDPSFGGNM